MRAFRKESFVRMDVRSTGMEFASEMVVKATLRGLRIVEVPTTLAPDGRSRPPHLRSWRDGWRHLRFLLLFCPRWLFLYPGLSLAILGTLLTVWLLPHQRQLGSVTLDIHTLLFAAMTIVVGVQATVFWAFANLYGMNEGWLPEEPRLRRTIALLTVERGLLIGGGLVLVGLVLGILAVSTWSNVAFGLLDPTQTMRLAIPSATCIVLGFEIAFSGFVMNVLETHQPAVEEIAGRPAGLAETRT